jgi:hypothetical protein
MRAKLCQDNELGQQQEKDRSFTLMSTQYKTRNRESDKGCEQGELL